jgi:hypothetical protein
MHQHVRAGGVAEGNGGQIKDHARPLAGDSPGQGLMEWLGRAVPQKQGFGMAGVDVAQQAGVQIKVPEHRGGVAQLGCIGGQARSAARAIA